MNAVPPPRPAPKVSVCMIAYRHEAFIAEAIRSVLMQQTDFPIELVIGEDHSPDGTAAVIGQHASTPQVEIRARCNPANLGMHRNFLATLGECRGEYVAMLEGDDYWTDPHKLQRQVDFLERNPDHAICFHPVDVWHDGRLGPDTRTREVPASTDIRDLALGNYMHTCSVLFRARLFDAFPPSFTASSAGDYFLHMLNARFGRIGKLPQKMAVYRVHEGGTWSVQPDMDLKILQYLECMIGHFGPEVDALLEQRHRDVAFRSFVARVEEPGVEQRLQRALRFGGENFATRLVPLVRAAKSFDERRLLRWLRRLRLA